MGRRLEGGVFHLHHYHCTAHEVLGIVRGSARLTFGGESGVTVEIEAGDVPRSPLAWGTVTRGPATTSWSSAPTRAASPRTCAPASPVNVPRSSKTPAEYSYRGRTAFSVSRGRWPNPGRGSSSRRSSKIIL
jgi:hypothetical protein